MYSTIYEGDTHNKSFTDGVCYLKALAGSRLRDDSNLALANLLCVVSAAVARKFKLGFSLSDAFLIVTKYGVASFDEFKFIFSGYNDFSEAQFRLTGYQYLSYKLMLKGLTPTAQGLSHLLEIDRSSCDKILLGKHKLSEAAFSNLCNALHVSKRYVAPLRDILMQQGALDTVTFYDSYREEALIP